MNQPLIRFIVFFAAAFVLINCNADLPKKKTGYSLKQVAIEKSEYDNTVFEPIYRRLKAGDTLAKSEIEDYSKHLDTRADFYGLLKEFNQEAIFPAEYNTFEKATESVLADWLSYPTELDTIPSKIELVKKVSFSEHDTTFIYFVLRFKTEEPHWAAKDGWMLGVVGPYFNTSKPYDWTSGTFSTFSKAKESTPEKEVAWAHKNVYRRSPE